MNQSQALSWARVDGSQLAFDTLLACLARKKELNRWLDGRPGWDALCERARCFDPVAVNGGSTARRDLLVLALERRWSLEESGIATELVDDFADEDRALLVRFILDAEHLGIAKHLADDLVRQMKLPQTYKYYFLRQLVDRVAAHVLGAKPTIFTVDDVFVDLQREFTKMIRFAPDQPITKARLREAIKAEAGQLEQELLLRYGFTSRSGPQTQVVRRNVKWLYLNRLAGTSQRAIAADNKVRVTEVTRAITAASNLLSQSPHVARIRVR